jgi:hypothetical protein
MDLSKAIDLGLEELNFTYSADGGVCSIKFGNSFAKSPSIDLIRAQLAYNRGQTTREIPTTIQ